MSSVAMEPRRVRIELPEEQKPGEKTQVEKKRDYLIVASLFLVPIFLFVMGLTFFLMSPAATLVTPYQFEIGRFSGVVDIYSHKDRVWTRVTRKGPRALAAYPHDEIKTLADSDVDFKIPNVFDLRLKESSLVEMLGHKRDTAAKAIRFRLVRGAVLGLPHESSKDNTLEIETPAFLAVVSGSSFLIQTEEGGSSSISILNGEVAVHSNRTEETVTVKSLETLRVANNHPAGLMPQRSSYQEWRSVTEVRDLITVTAEQIAEQVDLRKKAGSFFKYVFDEGVFYRPDFGFANCEFYEEPRTKTVVLKVDYDVYPPTSFSGVYFKTRELNLSKVHRLTFNLKAETGKPLPGQFRIEFKDRFSIVRVFAVKSISDDWRYYAFDFNAQKPTSVSEMVFVFEHSRVGALSTNGTVYIKDLNIE